VRNALEHFSQVFTASRLELNHCFAFPSKENGNSQLETDGLFGNSFDGEGTTYLQEVLEMWVGILMSFSTEGTSLHHRDQRPSARSLHLHY